MDLGYDAIVIGLQACVRIPLAIVGKELNLIQICFTFIEYSVIFHVRIRQETNFRNRINPVIQVRSRNEN